MTVTTSNSDPQATVGLTKCLDTLKRMELVWPSAGRAWELLHGAKNNFHEYEPTFSSAARPKKRTADESVDNTMPSTSQQHGMSNQVDSSNLAHHFSSSASATGFADPVSATAADDESPLAFFTSYDRWSSDNSLAFHSGLSTSVLPQQYSTGFADQRGMHRSSSVLDGSLAGSAGPGAHGDGEAGAGQSRFPQFWSDYTAVGQPSSMLSSMYGMPMLPTHMQSQQGSVGQQQHHQSQDGQQQQQLSQSTMFMDDQFGFLGTSLFLALAS